MHEYRRFIQSELDTRGWRQSDIARASGLSRQLVSTILKDRRDHLGQMPDAATMQGLADGLRIPVERVRTAAARSLVGYVDDGQPLTPALQDASLDALLNEIRRRVESSHDHAQYARDDDDPPASTRAPRTTHEKTETLADLLPNDETPRRGHR